MNHPTERRAVNHGGPEDALPPEVAALIVLCGGEIRESDRVPERRQSRPDRRGHDRRHGDRRHGQRRAVQTASSKTKD